MNNIINFNLSCNNKCNIIERFTFCLDQIHLNVKFFACFSWLVVLRFNTTLTAKVISWRSVTHMCFLAFSPVLIQLFFPKPPNTLIKCFCRGERRKYAGKKVRLNRGSNSQPPGHESTRSPLSHPCGACMF